MGMSNDKVKKAFGECRALIRRKLDHVHAGNGQRIDPNVHVVLYDPNAGDAPAVAHLAFMCEEGIRMMQEAERHLTSDGFLPVAAQESFHSKKEKAMRWLGFIQGALWGAGLTTIEEMKHVNMPEAERVEADPA